jgi:hypothetical protein
MTILSSSTQNQTSTEMSGQMNRGDMEHVRHKRTLPEKKTNRML